ncbi:hypothetical protein [Streptomyces lydicus]|uniref:hypothetical protein n=1 Tax=Streptomyces lydicus TaxID=47763 RepID=UPI00371465F2
MPPSRAPMPERVRSSFAGKSVEASAGFRYASGTMTPSHARNRRTRRGTRPPRLGPRLVLTAGHVIVRNDGTASPRVRVRSVRSAGYLPILG